jgi:N-acetylmuramoyl-L-alanine amidase
VLAVARELKELVDKTRGLRAIMIRDGDYYVKLRDRYEKARHAEADIFISIHADALASRHRAYGASVYALSERGASSAQAQALADKENAADLIGGVSLSDKDTLLAKVLLDLSQTATISSSLELGADVLRELGRVGPIHLDTVQQAGFAVLKAPDVPSILIETTFISNPTEEKKLRNKPYQRKLAAAVFNGIQSYLTRQLPRSPQLAGSGPRTYIVQPGDTLVGIARDYGVHVDTLRFANSLTGTDLRVGRRLVIP